MRTLLSLVFSVILAWACAYHAKRRGRNPSNWLIAGFFFGIFALATLFILPVRKALKRDIEPPAPQMPVLTLASPLHAEKLWYYLDEEKKQFGPMSFQALSTAWNEGSVREQTFVWNEAMENWQRFKEVIALPG